MSQNEISLACARAGVLTIGMTDLLLVLLIIPGAGVLAAAAALLVQDAVGSWRAR